MSSVAPRNQDCLDYKQGRVVYTSDPGMRNILINECHNWRCVARDPVLRRTDGMSLEQLEAMPYEFRLAAEAQETMSLRGPRFGLDTAIEYRKIINYGAGGFLNWADCMVQIRKWEMIESIEANSYMSIDVVKWLEGMKNSFVGDKISKKSTENAFTVFHCASPNGVLLQCQVNWNGRVIRGNDIPQEFKELLKDETIYKCQFNVLGDAKLLRSMGLTVNNIVEMRNVALECFPQR
jgi:hypothetical protein